MIINPSDTEDLPILYKVVFQMIRCVLWRFGVARVHAHLGVPVQHRGEHIHVHFLSHGHVQGAPRQLVHEVGVRVERHVDGLWERRGSVYYLLVHVPWIQQMLTDGCFQYFIHVFVYLFYTNRCSMWDKLAWAPNCGLTFDYLLH